MNQILHYLGGPLIGAAIGYCTNYIAVKMLFRPLKEVKIGNFTLPFTPGIIPKRKNELAVVVGRAVGDTLVTQEDINKILLSEEVENSIVEMCMNQLKEYTQSEESVRNALESFTGEERYEEGRNLLSEIIKEKILQGIRAMQPAELIATIGKQAVQEKLAGTMFSMFLSDSLVESVAGEIGIYAENYIIENSPVIIEEQVEKEITGIEVKSIHDMWTSLPVEMDSVENKLRSIYRSSISKFSVSLVKQFKIAEVVEEKIKAMDVLELENLVMSVMKHELGMIVNLGALIGLVLGILNLFF